jgi:hypothetical protein
MVEKEMGKSIKILRSGIMGESINKGTSSNIAKIME